MALLRFILINLIMGGGVYAYNILVLFPTPSFSHQLPVMALTEALIKRGHQLFVISPNVIPGLEKNYTFVDMSFSYRVVTNEKLENDENMDLQRQISKWDLPDVYRVYTPIAGAQFKTEPFIQFQKRVKAEKISFDLSIVESFFIPHGCAMTRLLSGYATPIATLSTTTAAVYGEEDIGSMLHLSYTPSLYDALTDKMSLLQRIDNWFTYRYITPEIMDIVENSARSFFRETYGPDHEKLVDGCWGNVSLAMISSNFLYYYPRLLAPNTVELGPLHIKPPGKLPQNLQDWLNGAEKGVIYFSLGSNMKSNALPVDVRTNFLKFFQELPAGYRVLWKWEADGKIPGQPDSILVQKWMPQTSILAHPKVKVFIMQGGIQSFQETVHYGVPIVGIPWFGDQEQSVAKIVDAEIGTRIRPQDLHSFEKVKSAIEAVLYDERYRRNMKKLSAISRDLTAQAVDKGVFWVEHIAKHGHAAHLRPSTAGTTLFQFLCLDIISVILVISIIVLYLLVLVFKCVISSVFSSQKSKIKKS